MRTSAQATVFLIAGGYSGQGVVESETDRNNLDRIKNILGVRFRPCSSTHLTII